MRLASLLLTSLILAHPAQALEACFGDSIGDWRGPVFDSGRTRRMETEFHPATGGGLAGTYHVGATDSYDGTLTNFHQTGPCEADFEWTDPYGVGIVHIRFNPDHGRFDGRWGDTAPIPGHFFNGRRTRPAATS